MPVPQHVSIVTIGARDLPSLRAFYARWGWNEAEAATEGWAAFDVGGWLLALYPIDQLGSEAAPDVEIPQPGWNGVTLAINVGTRDELRLIFDAAVDAGATVVAPITPREWGGMSGYLADPEGNRWELATSGPPA